MAFQVRPDESVARGVRRVARDQIDKALVGLNGRTHANLEEVVHDVRKRLKKVRAVIRLARDGLGRKVAGREDDRFRDAGHPLSEVRDAGILVKTLEKLVERRGDRHPLVVAIGAVREPILRRKGRILRRVHDEGHVLAKLIETLEAARRDVKRWRIAGDDWDSLEGGLERIYRRGSRAFHEASESPTDEALHEWRKRVKDLWYALDLLKPVRPGFTEPRAEEARRLADQLGEDHDLAVLRQVLTGSEGMPFGRDPVGAILPLVEDRRVGLRREAFTLGTCVYAERPKAFVARFRAYWRAWRAEAEAVAVERPPRRLTGQDTEIT